MKFTVPLIIFIVYGVFCDMWVKVVTGRSVMWWKKHGKIEGKEKEDWIYEKQFKDKLKLHVEGSVLIDDYFDKTHPGK